MAYPTKSDRYFLEGSKYFVCQACAGGIAAKTAGVITCPNCGQRYIYRKGRLKRLEWTNIPSKTRIPTLQKPLVAVHRWEPITKQVNFRETIPPATGQVLSAVSPLTGEVIDAVAFWPDGCNQLVLIRGGVHQVQSFPVTGYVALNNTSQSFPIYKEVVRGDRIWIEIQNQDAVNPHTPSIIFTVKGVLKLWPL